MADILTSNFSLAEEIFTLLYRWYSTIFSTKAKTCMDESFAVPLEKAQFKVEFTVYSKSKKTPRIISFKLGIYHSI
jgi:hypothetical protein